MAVKEMSIQEAQNIIQTARANGVAVPTLETARGIAQTLLGETGFREVNGDMTYGQQESPGDHHGLNAFTDDQLKVISAVLVLGRK